MVKVDMEGLQNLRCLLLIMELATGLKVNWSKFTLNPVGCVPTIERLVAVLECGVKSLPITYLGLPLGAKSSSLAIWNPVLERLSTKLSGWKGQYFSKGGKLVLLKNVLACMSTYFYCCLRLQKWLLIRWRDS